MMNSDDEKRLFERHGWQYDTVGRKWIAPDGYEVSTDDLVAAADVLGSALEMRIVRVAREHRYRSA